MKHDYYEFFCYFSLAVWKGFPFLSVGTEHWLCRIFIISGILVNDKWRAYAVVLFTFAISSSEVCEITGELEENCKFFSYFYHGELEENWYFNPNSYSMSLIITITFLCLWVCTSTSQLSKSTTLSFKKKKRHPYNLMLTNTSSMGSAPNVEKALLHG